MKFSYSIGGCTIAVALAIGWLAFTTPVSAASFTDNFTNPPGLSSGWTWVDSVGNATRGFTGDNSHYYISVPAGSSHDCWNTSLNCARLMRAITGANATFEIKVDGVTISQQHQYYGLMLWQDNSNYIRFEFWTAGSGVQVNVYRIIGGNGDWTYSGQSYTMSATNYLRIINTGVRYELQYSANGSTWNTAYTFNQNGFTPSQAGIYTGNATGNPATTGNFDYFKVTEEGGSTATLTLQAQDDASVSLPGATVRLDGSIVGVTPTSTTANFGSHSVTYDNTVACYNYTSTSPVQPMTVNGDTTVTGTFTLNLPTAVNTPIPTNGATGVSTTSSVTWAATSCTASFDVYLGTSQAAVQSATTGSPEYKGNQATTSYTPGTPLSGSTTYYWRIDARNRRGVAAGTVWSFTTAAAGPLSCVPEFNGSYPGNSTCVFSAQANDPEGDEVYYLFTWGQGPPLFVPATDGSMPAGASCVGWTSGSTVPSGTWCTATHTYNAAGDFTAFVVAYDEVDHQSQNSGSALVHIASAGVKPYTPVNTLPINNSYSPLLPTFTWTGGDPDGIVNTLTYRIYLAQTGNPGALFATITGKLGSQTTISYTPPSVTLTSGVTYDWYVTADDTPSPPPSYPERPVQGAVTKFTVNRVPTVSNVQIATTPPTSPVKVNTAATISWYVQDADAQPITYSISYSAQAAVFSEVNKIATGNVASPTCTYNSAQSRWECSYVWNSSSLINPACVPENSGEPWYAVVRVNDNYDYSEAKSPAYTFSFLHTVTVTEPTSGWGLGRNNQATSFGVGAGSIKPNTSFIKYKGAASCPFVTNPGTRANGGPLASYSGRLNRDVSTGDIPLENLIPGDANNQLVFTTTDCDEVNYSLHYDLVTSCNQPYVSAQRGSIYSSGDITARYAPPTDKYNATYFILGGTTGESRKIQNFVAEPPPANITLINPAFREQPYPGTSDATNTQSRMGMFDYYGLTHRLDGTEVSEGEDTNLYGYTVVTIQGDTKISEGKIFSDPNNISLNGKVYYIRNGGLIVDSVLTFLNGSGASSGAGLIIVDNDLQVEARTFSYADAAPESVLRNLASVGWLVRGNINLADSVTQIVGAYYSSGVVSGGVVTGGTIDTGGGSDALTVYGTMIARQFRFLRTASPGGEPSERVVADGRVLVNTPPGFRDLLSILPSWQFSKP